jgi:hypothetical protein
MGRNNISEARIPSRIFQGFAYVLDFLHHFPVIGLLLSVPRDT